MECITAYVSLKYNICIIIKHIHVDPFDTGVVTYATVKKFPAFYGTRMFITVFTRARHLPYFEPDQSSPLPPNRSRENIF
jgi:hypothetical protein